MAERKQVDWESVERDYSAGLLSLREIADKYGVSEGLVRRKATQNEWNRDLSKKIQDKADSIVRKESVRSSVRTEKAVSEKEVIEANAQAIVNVKLGHRTSIKKVNGLVESLLDEIETLNKDKSVENLPMRVDVTKKLMDTLKTSIDKERQAFGIVDAPTPAENAVTELLKACQGSSVSITTSTNDFDEDDE
jgi:predicted house-cleaning noncanonical NTP pyrophosphatase (MazG superfamily)